MLPEDHRQSSVACELIHATGNAHSNTLSLRERAGVRGFNRDSYPLIPTLSGPLSDYSPPRRV